jgi:hypothetical protein
MRPSGLLCYFAVLAGLGGRLRAADVFGDVALYVDDSNSGDVAVDTTGGNDLLLNSKGDGLLEEGESPTIASDLLTFEDGPSSSNVETNKEGDKDEEEDLFVGVGDAAQEEPAGEIPSNADLAKNAEDVVRGDTLGGLARAVVLDLNAESDDTDDHEAHDDAVNRVAIHRDNYGDDDNVLRDLMLEADDQASPFSASLQEELEIYNVDDFDDDDHNLP